MGVVPVSNFDALVIKSYVWVMITNIRFSAVIAPIDANMTFCLLSVKDQLETMLKFRSGLYSLPKVSWPELIIDKCHHCSGEQF